MDFLDYELRFFLFVVALRNDDWHAPSVARPQILVNPLRVGRDETARRVQDGLRRAVVFLKRNQFGVWIVILKAQDVANVGVAPGVYGLVRIAHHADVQMNARKLLGYGVLRDVGVLEFVDHKVNETVLVFSRHIGLALE